MKHKKLRYREEHSASVLLIGVLNDIYRETINISTANQPLLRNWPRKAIEFRRITQNYGHYAVQGHSRSPILVPIESPYTTANIPTSDISLKTRFFRLHFTRGMYPCIFNHFCVIGPKTTEFGEITQTIRPLRCSRSFKVIDFGTNRKPICDFLLVINSNLPPILHRFQVANY